ncbi:hypothetical protein [Neiella marina]|uniref:hypothetical protein n=1 Tax=Neiella marina TaxID=508461 RepID=UPI001302AE1E|nr:hypothetical protein [Neiella marina]
MHSSWQINVYSPRMACVRISGDCKSYEMLIPDQRPYMASRSKPQGKWRMSVPYSATKRKTQNA